jgi:hypothetical protein
MLGDRSFHAGLMTGACGEKGTTTHKRSEDMRSALIGVLGAAALCGAAAADLTGNTVTAQWWYPDKGSSIESHNVVVGPGVELPFDVIVNDDKFDIDLTGDTVTFLFNSAANWTATGFNGWHFTDTNGTISEISGYVVDEVSDGIGNVGAILVGNTADQFWANFAGVTVAGNGDFVRLRLTFVPAPGAAGVLALAGLGVLRRRR